MRLLAAAIVVLVMIGGWTFLTAGDPPPITTDQPHTAPTPLAFPTGLALMGAFIAMRKRRRPTPLT